MYSKWRVPYPGKHPELPGQQEASHNMDVIFTGAGGGSGRSTDYGPSLERAYARADTQGKRDITRAFQNGARSAADLRRAEFRNAAASRAQGREVRAQRGANRAANQATFDRQISAANAAGNRAEVRRLRAEAPRGIDRRVGRNGLAAAAANGAQRRPRRRPAAETAPAAPRPRRRNRR